MITSVALYVHFKAKSLEIGLLVIRQLAYVTSVAFFIFVYVLIPLPLKCM